jgi:hypothetical protein
LKIVGYPKKALIRQIIIGVLDKKGTFCSRKGAHFLHSSELEIVLSKYCVVIIISCG